MISLYNLKNANIFVFKRSMPNTNFLQLRAQSSLFLIKIVGLKYLLLIYHIKYTCLLQLHSADNRALSFIINYTIIVHTYIPTNKKKTILF